MGFRTQPVMRNAAERDGLAIRRALSQATNAGMCSFREGLLHSGKTEQTGQRPDPSQILRIDTWP